MFAGIRKSDKALLVWRGDQVQPAVATLTKICGLAIRQKSELNSSDIVLFQASATGQPSVTRVSKDGGKTWAVIT
jgi:hypothetical protein